MSARSVAFSVKMSAEDHQRLKDLAEHFAINGTAVLRMLVKREHDRVVAMPQAIREKLADARKGTGE